MEMRKLSIVMPVFNEVDTVETIVRKVMAVDCGLAKELIISDDGSTDGTRDVLERLSREYPADEVKVIYAQRNRGKGAALREGFARATGDIVIIQDADLEYDPGEYRVLLGPILDGKADVVYGSRFLGGPHRVLYFWHYLGNKFLTFFSNMLYNINMTDMETCYKVFRADALKKIAVRSNGFAVEPELTAKVCKLGCRIYEVPISYSGRSYEEGKKITWVDGFRTLWALLKFRFID